MGFLKILTRRPGKETTQSHDTQLRPETILKGSLSANCGQTEALGTLNSLPNDSHRPKKPSAQSDYFEMRSRAPIVVPHRRGHVVEDRPGTAASDQSASQDWFQSPARSKRDPRRPPISFRKPSSSASLSAAYLNPTQVEGKENEDGQEGLRGRNSSISSLGSRRFKDLLDAQEEIRPTDFRSRLQATGARDYGEDVADRNISRSGKTHTQAIPSQLSENNRGKYMNPPSYFSQLRQAYTKGQVFGSVPVETSSMNGAGEVSSVTRRTKQRLSLNTYVPSGMASHIKPRSANTSPGLTGITESKDFALPDGRPVSAGRQYNSSPTASNFCVPRSSKGSQRTVLEWREFEWKEFLERYGYDQDIDDQFEDARALENRSESDLSSHRTISNLNVSHPSLSRYSRRESHQSFMSSLASSVASRPSSLEITPLTWPKPRNEDNFIDTKGIADDIDGSVERPQSRFSQHHSLMSNNSEDQRGFHRTKSLGLLSSPLEADEQAPERPSSTHNGTASEVSKSESTGSFNVYSVSSGRPYSRHTASTSLDSTSHALSIRKSEESSLSASNGQRGTSTCWSPETLSTGFNIDDYVSSDDDSFTIARKGPRPSAEGEEDLLFKPGYGIMGVALPGLEELEEDSAYPALPCRPIRSNSLSSDGSAAIAAGPVDNRVNMARDIPTPLRQVQSDPEMEVYGGTFGRNSMRNRFRDSEMSASAGEDPSMPSAVDFDDYFRPLIGTTTVGSENGLYEEAPAPNRGLMRLSALGHPIDRSVGPDPRPAKSAAEMIKEEKGRIDIATAVRVRKEEKARRRAEGLRDSRERRLTRTPRAMEVGWADGEDYGPT